MDSLDSGGALGWPRTSRPRVNSAIDVAGFLSQVSNRAGKNPRYAERSMDYARWTRRVLEPAPIDRTARFRRDLPRCGQSSLSRWWWARNHAGQALSDYSNRDDGNRKSVKSASEFQGWLYNCTVVLSGRADRRLRVSLQ